VFDLEHRTCRPPTPGESNPGADGTCTLRLVYSESDPSSADVTLSSGCTTGDAELALAVAGAKVRWAAHRQ